MLERLMRWAVVVCAWCLLPGLARAQEFDESFESGSLSPGWTVYTAAPEITVSVTAAAAHRGNYGFRMQDANPSFCGNNGTYAESKAFDGGGALYLRAWTRLSGWNHQNGPSFFDAYSFDGGAHGQAADVCFDNAANLCLVIDPLDLHGTDLAFQGANSMAPIDDGGWHLVEAAALPSKVTAIYLDGAQVISFDVTGTPDYAYPVRLEIGEEYKSPCAADAGFEGVVDLDDVRADTAPLPSRLTVSGPTTVEAGACTAWTVSLAASAPYPDGGPALSLGAPYDVSVTFGGLDAFSDPACQQLEASVVLSTGSTGTVFYGSPNAGSSVLSVAQVAPADFLPGSLAVTATRSGAEPWFLVSCAGAPGDTGFLALLLLLLLRRRQIRA